MYSIGEHIFYPLQPLGLTASHRKNKATRSDCGLNADFGKAFSLPLCVYEVKTHHFIPGTA